jgi:hypothetical protein
MQRRRGQFQGVRPPPVQQQSKTNLQQHQRWLEAEKVDQQGVQGQKPTPNQKDQKVTTDSSSSAKHVIDPR